MQGRVRGAEAEEVPPPLQGDPGHLLRGVPSGRLRAEPRAREFTGISRDVRDDGEQLPGQPKQDPLPAGAHQGHPHRPSDARQRVDMGDPGHDPRRPLRRVCRSPRGAGELEQRLVQGAGPAPRLARAAARHQEDTRGVRPFRDAPVLPLRGVPVFARAGREWRDRERSSDDDVSHARGKSGTRSSERGRVRRCRAEEELPFRPRSLHRVLLEGRTQRPDVGEPTHEDAHGGPVQMRALRADQSPPRALRCRGGDAQGGADRAGELGEEMQRAFGRVGEAPPTAPGGHTC